MTESELKPCPFCGRNDIDYIYIFILPSYMQCEWCGCQGPHVYADDEKQAIDLWNERI